MTRIPSVTCSSKTIPENIRQLWVIQVDRVLFFEVEPVELKILVQEYMEGGYFHILAKAGKHTIELIASLGSSIRDIYAD